MPNVKIGCQLPQGADNFDRIVEVARECEKLGYDSVWLYDHLSPFWAHSSEALECWTTLSAVAARTSKVKIGTLVTNVGLRNPGLLAKMASTVDNISGGRLILGLGTGDRMSREELGSYGYKFPSLEERVELLKENILILKAMWTKDLVTFHGKHYEISDAVNLPKPKQHPHPPIWIGGKHLRILDVVAELADGWNYWGFSKSELERCKSYLSVKCRDYGRNPDSIVKSWAGTYVSLSQGSSGRAEVMRNIVTRLRKQTDASTKYFIASFGSQASPESYQTFADAAMNLA